MLPDLSALAPVVRWDCPRCTQRAVTREAQPHSRMHDCAGLGGLSAPMRQEGEHVKITVNEREDYIGTEDVQYANGRPIMNVVTEHPDGRTDVAVYAPTAHSRRD